MTNDLSLSVNKCKWIGGGSFVDHLGSIHWTKAILELGRETDKSNLKKIM